MRIKVSMLIMCLIFSIVFFSSVEGKNKRNITNGSIPIVSLPVSKNIPSGEITLYSKITDPELLDPKAGAFDKNGNIFVLDSKACEIYKFSPKGILLKKAGKKGNGPAENVFPVKIVIFKDKLFIVDYSRPYINIFDLDLKFIEQKKFERMNQPSDIIFLNEKELIITSPTMPLALKNRIFVYDMNGRLKSMHIQAEFDYKNATQGRNINLNFPPLVSIDSKNGNIWSAEIDSYLIDSYDNSFKLKKTFKGDIEFRTKEHSIGQDNQLKMKIPVDKGLFFKVIGGRIYYCYKFHEETILDIISNEKLIKRYKLAQIKRIFDMENEDKIMVVYADDESEDEDATPVVGIIKLNK